MTSYQLYRDLQKAIDPHWPNSSYCFMRSHILQNLWDAERTAARREADPCLRQLAFEEGPKELVRALGQIRHLPSECIIEIFTILRNYREVYEPLLHSLPGGRGLFINGGGDFGMVEQVLFRVETLPTLASFTVDISYSEQIKSEGIQKFMKRIGARAISQHHDGAYPITIYFDTEEEAVLQRMKL